ncbi:TetR/AcrR family transcriptional regulator [Parachitinimonas caeni]|uniref:TetR family transcriptional regulator n=1 Tax=Parachitinimonas caeni TaxID=3031301 RepID=A0ABT7DX89_9NEIS|nr:TetR family transcriptional regulator [Parachitinimonas caeni]MDK2124680.1 TetR family transcriptional regulator [Parachitinimonas caeni]
MKQRAIADEDKQARRDSLLAAARSLYLEDTRQLPAVSRIAEAAGLAKGTVYLYFQTKEEIFTALLDQEFSALLDRLTEHFLTASGTPWERVNLFLEFYAKYLQEHPEFLRLAAMANSVLEQNLAQDHVYNFKLQLAQRLERTGNALESALSVLETGSGARLMVRTYALTLGLWQLLDYPDAMREVMMRPALRLLAPDFATELTSALKQFWRGVLADQ